MDRTRATDLHRAPTLAIVGHRGAMAAAPENTMRSFALAANLGVDAIELDVHLSRDGHLAIMHDRTVDRTTDGSGPIAELDWAALRRLDAGAGEPVPELAEVWAAFPSVGLQIEVKDRAATTAVLDLISAGPARDAPTTITSFHPEVLREASQRTGPWQVGLIFGRLDEARLAEGLDLEVDQVLIHWALSDTAAARDQRARVRAANVWISRTPQDIWRAMAEGWTETTVDDPAMALAARAGYEPALRRP